MSARKRKLKQGVRWAYDKTVRGTRLWSPYVYLTKKEAERAEAAAVAHFLATGQRPPTSGPPSGGETVAQLYTRWIKWLESHRSARHARDMRSLMSRALAVAPEMMDLLAAELTIEQVEEWAERWASDLLERGKGRGEVNKWLRYSQTAWNAPWGRRRRAVREYPFNPFAHVDRYQVEHRAKYVPPEADVIRIRMAADGEFRLYLELLIETGARPSEGLNLAWEDVQAGAVILYTKKTGTGDRLPRRVPISDDLRARFKSWRRAQGSGKVYVFQQKDQERGHRLVWARRRHVAACSRAGVEYFSVGCYRHYHAVTYYAQTKDVIAVQRRLGHRDIKTTQHYLASLTGV